MVMFVVAFFKRLEYQCCVGKSGIITMAFALSLYIFAVIFASRLQEGKIKYNSVLHLLGKASITMKSEPGLVIYAGGKNFSNLVFQTYMKYFEISNTQFSVNNLTKDEKKLSASVFCVSGMFIIYLRYHCYVTRHNSDTFIVSSLSSMSTLL